MCTFLTLDEYTVTKLARKEEISVRRYRRRRMEFRLKGWAKLLLFLSVLFLILIEIDLQLRPVITTMAEYQCRVVSDVYKRQLLVLLKGFITSRALIMLCWRNTMKVWFACLLVLPAKSRKRC